nr:hypothetical protein [Tanacetum cinerariifolium]
MAFMSSSSNNNKNSRNEAVNTVFGVTTVGTQVMIGVTKLKKDLTMHLWHTTLQVLILREKDGIQLTVEKLENASKSLNKLIDSQTVDNCKKGLGYNVVPPPHTVETLNAKTSEKVPKVVKKDNGAPIIEDWKSDDEDECVP